jgi:6-phosphogluconolactonase/glucosamine-6-phosphate isomerase/deaminase
VALTYRLLARAPRVMWLITGEDKVEALLRLQAGDGAIPAGRISTADRS